MNQKQVGIVKQLNRFPVKSMRGEALEKTHVYWYGFDGDRRYAFVRGDVNISFPWLTGRQIPQLVQYEPRFMKPEDVNSSPVEVKTPNGRLLPITSPELKTELAEAYGKEIHLIQIGRGTFDAQQLSLMSLATANALSRLMGDDVSMDRFRQNIIIETTQNMPYEEEEWLDGVLTFGTGSDGARIRLNRRIQRCAMITIDPETAVKDPAILKTVAQQRDNCTGVYASTEKPGYIRVGAPIFLNQ